MYFTSNIKFLRKRRGRTQDEVAAALNLKRSTLSGYENGVAQPGIEILVSFSGYFSMSVDTLLKVDMTKLSESQLGELERGYDAYIRGSNLRVLVTTVDKENRENIELVAEKAKAGYTTGYADPEYIGELPVFRLPFLSDRRKYRTFQLKGDSMLPIPDGSWVTGEFLQDWNEIKSGNAYIVFTINDGIVFKIIENRLMTDGRLVLYSLNPVYEPYEVSINEVKEIWKFVNYISEELPEPVLPEKQLIRSIASMKDDLEKIKARLGRDISDACEVI
ncbi:MAG TPA: LexA family transcriptional regulator [Bacteroidales bacterium]|jgi:transcriptional regulator with XRE-family HTH domain|nr:helix-turn-helix domain-containing protein [Bacteroidales bacterium]HNR42649.1 LexA family transcriptional regulator [Bacteroidales bacterium]HPM18522.1 LexA family transcriptional regulator [Bacteroidales bacterium]HQG78258.1 LexA family transcriptional regulator [Bacteroidales bacterium]